MTTDTAGRNAFGSPLRRNLNIALVDTTRSSWWREVLGRYLGAE
jgi:hypothetical protein